MPVRPQDLHRQADGIEREARAAFGPCQRAALLAFAKRLRERADDLERRRATSDRRAGQA